MVSEQQIVNSLPHILKTVDIPELGQKIQGKVRDIYMYEGKRITITTDRQSAFDRVLCHVPYKGAVLNMISAFWFEKTRSIVDNHMIAAPDPNVLVSKNLKGIPVEMIVRGYMTGVTNTSIWYSYQKGERNIYGIDFPEGLKKNDKLPQPVITPTTHALPGTHDERLDHKKILENNLASEDLYDKMEKVALALFDFGTKWCEARGIILVDTKYEFGLSEGGKLTLMDEIHTPDSSRFWKADTYETRHAKGEEPESYDKEFLRLWYKNQGYTGEGEPPEAPQDLVVRLSELYVSAYEKITGRTFEAFEYPIEERIKRNILIYLQTST